MNGWQRLKVLFVLVALASASALGALPGVTEIRKAPADITDAELSAMLGARVEAADVVAIGETVHGSAGLLAIQDRLIRYLVTSHGLRLIAWENPVLRSRELGRWVDSCREKKTPPPLDVLYLPTAADRPLWDWVCEFNHARRNDPIVVRGMDVWDRPWAHYAAIRKLGPALGIDRSLLQGVASACPAHEAASWTEVNAVLATSSAGGFDPEAGYVKCRALLTSLMNASRQRGAEMRARKEVAADAFELALSASTLLGWLGFYHHQRTDDVLSWNERDQAQGRNLALLMEMHAMPRAIVSAHSSHVSHGRSPADWWGSGDLKSGIHFFSAMTGKRVFNMALTAYAASGAQGEWSLPIAASSMDRKLHDAGHAFSFFTSAAAFLAEHAKWWMQNQNFPGPYASGVEIIPRDHFDAYFFLADSWLDRALPARPMWEP